MAKPDSSKLNQIIDDCETGMWSVAADWLQNKCFAHLLQYTTGTGDRNLVELTPRVKDSRRITVSLWGDRRRTLIAKMTAQQPIPVVTPVSSSSEDRSVARESEHLVADFWRTHQLARELDYSAQDAVDCGGYWWQIIWDPTKGDKMQVPRQDPSDLSVQEPEFDEVPTGDLCVGFVSNFEMRVDPTATRLDQARWLARVHYLSVSEIMQRWGKTVSADMQGSRPGLMAGIDWLLNPQKTMAQDIARVLEFWQKPTPDYPKGFYAVASSSEMLYYNKELPDGEFPFEYGEFDPDCDNFYGSTPLSAARRPQAELNAALSMLSDGRARGGHGAWLQPRGCAMDTPTGRPMEVLGYNDNSGKPDFIEPRPVAPQVIEILSIFDSMIGRTTGVTDSDDTTSGRDRLYAAEQDNTKLGPALRSLHAFLKRVAAKMLRTWQRNATFDMTYAVSDPNQQSDVRTFSAKKIRFRDVDMSIDSALPLNRQARREQIIQYMQVGLIDQAQAKRMLEFGDTGDVVGTANLDRERARNENTLLYVGPVAVRQWEDHAIHLEEHLSEMKQARAYEQFDQNANIAQVFDQHCDEHRYYLQVSLGMGLTNPAEQSNNGAGSVGQMADVPAANASNAMLPIDAPVSSRDNQALGVINAQNQAA